MKSKVECNDISGFQMPEDYREVLEKCSRIPEIPTFSTPFKLSEIKSLININSPNSVLE